MVGKIGDKKLLELNKEYKIDNIGFYEDFGWYAEIRDMKFFVGVGSEIQNILHSVVASYSLKDVRLKRVPMEFMEGDYCTLVVKGDK